MPTAGTGDTRPAEGRVCGSAYSARAVPHSASQPETMGQTAGPSGMQRQRPRPKLRQKPSLNIVTIYSHVLFYVSPTLSCYLQYLSDHEYSYAPINCTPDQPLYGNGWGLGGVLTRVDSEISPGGAGK